MFIQVIQGQCKDPDGVRRLTEEWRERMAPTVVGWLGGTYGITDDDRFVGVVRFESREAAARSAATPEQAAWLDRLRDCFDGELMFHDCDNAMMFLGGGSDEAGFVQVIQGRVTDADRFRHMFEEPMDLLHEHRPEIIGGTVAVDKDGYFTETVAFRTEAEAREGEKKEMPEEIRREMERDMALTQDVVYLDLHRPWFASAAAGPTGMARP